MSRLTATHARRVRSICDEFDTLRIGGPPVLATVLSDVCDMIGLVGCVYRVREGQRGWEIDLWHSTHPRSEELEQRFKTFLIGRQELSPLYHPARPPPEQRNRVIDPIDMMTPDQIETEPILHELYRPAGIWQHHQLRVLVCEGPSLLAWFGGFLLERPHAEQYRLLAALVPAVRRRLSIDRRLRDAPRTFGALGTALELLGAPAFVVNRKGKIEEVSTSARALLAVDGSTVRAAIRDAVAHRPSALRFELTPFNAPGAEGYLAVLRDPTEDARIAERVTLAAARWGLSSRQREVLHLIVRGAANGLIAQTLRIAERTVEFHVTALFDRVGVETRAALTAAVLALR
jgi:DNA-binding CsgD family transcriptional regulator